MISYFSRKNKGNHAIQILAWKKILEARNFGETMHMHMSEPISGSTTWNIHCSIARFLHSRLFHQRNCFVYRQRFDANCILKMFASARLGDVDPIHFWHYENIYVDIEMRQPNFNDSGRVYAFANVTSGHFDAYANYTRNPLSSAALSTHTQFNTHSVEIFTHAKL